MENGYLNTKSNSLNVKTSEGTDPNQVKSRSKPELNKDGVTTVIYPVLFGVFILLLWQTQLLHKILGTDTFTLPLPGRIINIILGNIPEILKNVQATVIVAAGGLVLGSALGYLLGIVAMAFPQWGYGGISIASAFTAVPIVAIAPILNNLTKDFSDDPNARSMLAKTLVVMITCTVSMSINAYRGFTELKPYSLDLMKSYAASPMTVFLKLRMPNSLPYVFTALRVSVPTSIISALVSEYFAEYIIGVGRQIREGIVLAQYATAWAYIIVACAIGILMYAILLIAEGIILKDRRNR
ncbi:MAG: NitT/TauT family transport system permease protein [Epulopiscium sp.]|jgi:NitT/TauT family transport system permease protein|uniref:ABC transporter permease subunit n=1 Tax=Defluviitalea raffinosedens TaxID=1450156 RepID=A0A7C8LFP8_9FIRM|nr:ABC transporter permease subunit [Defluviitalea raffinosedens]KAE9630669.1 ABC transporter permease subunit [Defluviitalea raffinosedens]MBZ4667157.1 transporter permease subunit [Defluviitaleaceae bacterium]MDK2788735.1 NitT/TauT family transport system permease protein [Candidatus Epulonipiscium sp.]HHW67823.1 ABC transporter permease subunit [Candidatus Epulonipiscium sp.]